MSSNQNRDFFTCQICQKEHHVPKSGFVVSNRLKNLVSFELNNLKVSPAFDECKKKIEDARSKLVMIEEFERNAETYIYDYFQDIKRDVDLRRETLKLKIDNYSDEIIQSIELNQQNYIKLSQEVNQIALNIENSKKKLNSLMSQFDTLDFSDDKFKETKNNVSSVIKEINKILGLYHDSLIGNKKYTFEFKELPLKEIFGHLKACEVSFFSNNYHNY
jgi:hypothetical protein